MSGRVVLLSVLVTFLAVYAWRDWYKSLCALVLMMAVMQHPDMPKTILGIQGLNLWNLLMADIVLAWLVSRRREGLIWDVPTYIMALLALYFCVVTVSFIRLALDRYGIIEEEMTFGYLISEYWINCVKWVIPGILLFDGCRTRRRLQLALCCILGLYVLLALQVIRWMPMSAAVSGDVLSGRALKIIQNEVGYSRVNMSMLLSGASWGTLAVVPLLRRRWTKAMILVLFFVLAYGQGLTGGRMGYVAWITVGILLCLIRWRIRLLFLPLVIAVVVTVSPGIADRMRQGFGATDVSGMTYTDDYEVTSGRTLAWPYVIDKIGESPLIGYGREAMARTGLRDLLWESFTEAFPHPHNAYLELLLDNGVVGFIMVIPFYCVVLFHAGRLFVDSRNPVFAVVGGVTLSLVLAMMVAAMGSQTFYPREGAVGMWAAIGLTLRVSVERGRLYSSAVTPSASVRTVARQSPKPAPGAFQPQ